MDEVALGRELTVASQYGGPQRRGVLERSPLLTALLQQAGLQDTSENLVYLLDRGIERLPVEQQEVARAAFRRPPYSADVLEDRLSDAAWRAATERTETLRADPARDSASAPVRSLKTMVRRRNDAILLLAPSLVELAQRLCSQSAGGPEEQRPIAGDRSEFVADRTIPDGALLRPGEKVDKVWELRNAGTVPWIGRWLVRMGTIDSRSTPTTPDRVPISETQPGKSVRVVVPIEAPPLPGTYEIHWKMADADNRLYFPDRYWAGVWFTVVVPGRN